MITWAGLEFECPADVFSPRDSSLPMIEIAEASTQELSGTIGVIDLCCGSGAIGIAICRKYPNRFTHMIALDAFPSAVRCCTHNMKRHGVEGEAQLWKAGDPIPSIIGEALIVCNPPYLPPTTETRSERERLWIVSDNGGLYLPFQCLRSAAKTPFRIVMKGLSTHVPLLDEAFEQLCLVGKYVLAEDVVVTVWHPCVTSS
jgi:methylase of polypeptide subunit release factors